MMAGCAQTPLAPIVIDVPVAAPTSSEPVSQPSSQVTVIKLEPSEFTAELSYAPGGQYLSAWKTDAEELIFNGGYFDPDFRPSGLLVINKTSLGSRIFDQDKSGLVVIDKDGAVSIRDLATSPLKPKEEFEYALQSYPFLIKEGKPALTTDSQKIARRTALGIDEEGNIYIFTATANSPTLYKFMKQIDQLQLPLISVLNLDGGPSTGIISNRPEDNLFIDSYTKISNILRFRKK